jgi:hypothetical protein
MNMENRVDDPKAKVTMKWMTQTIHCDCGHSEVIDSNKNRTTFGEVNTISPPYVCPKCKNSYSRYDMVYKQNQVFKNRLIAIGLVVAIIGGFVAFNFKDWQRENRLHNQWVKDEMKKKDIKKQLKNE